MEEKRDIDIVKLIRAILNLIIIFTVAVIVWVLATSFISFVSNPSDDDDSLPTITRKDILQCANIKYEFAMTTSKLALDKLDLNDPINENKIKSIKKNFVKTYKNDVAKCGDMDYDELYRTYDSKIKNILDKNINTSSNVIDKYILNTKDLNFDN